MTASPTFAEVAGRLLYDPFTGAFWRQPSVTVDGRFYSGRPATLTARNGYRVVSIGTRQYLAHRVAFLLMTGVWPAEVDHINGKRDDNRWMNLRLATRAQNNANRGVQPNNVAGVKGVSLCRCTGRWRAVIMVGGKQISLGRHTTLAAAASAYARAAVEHYGEFARAA